MFTIKLHGAFGLGLRTAGKTGKLQGPDTSLLRNGVPSKPIVEKVLSPKSFMMMYRDPLSIARSANKQAA